MRGSPTEDHGGITFVVAVAYCESGENISFVNFFFFRFSLAM